jgi:hypothetical protein
MKENKTRPKKERLSLDFSEGTKVDLEKKRILAGLPTLVELFRRAIETYTFLLQRQKAGWRVVLMKEGEDNEVYRVI